MILTVGHHVMDMQRMLLSPTIQMSILSSFAILCSCGSNLPDEFYKNQGLR